MTEQLKITEYNETAAALALLREKYSGPFDVTTTKGMTAARECPDGQHLLIDKDFVAVEYARLNCQKNGLTNTHVQLSNGFNDVDKDKRFSLVMSNLPAKVGKEQHYLYLLDAYERMEVGGRFYVVTINGLRQFMKRAFTEVFGNADKVKQGKTYTITKAVKV